MSFFDKLSSAYNNGKAAGEKSAAKDLQKGKDPSVAKAMAKGAGSALKAEAPNLIRTLLKLSKF